MKLVNSIIMAVKDYDVVIIGGGPAGSSCGIFLKKLNPSLKVCIIDKKSFPRNKPCGDGLSPGVVDLIHEAGMDDLFYEKHAIKIFELSCGKNIDIKYELQNLYDKSSYGFVYPRESFDNKLIGHALKEGVDIYPKHEITELKELNEWCTEISCKASGECSTFTGRVIVGADGAYSKIRSYLKIPVNDDKHIGVSLRYYCTVEKFEEMSLRIDILKNLRHSYGWVFPVSESMANVGIGVDTHIYKKDKINLNKEFDNYLAFLKTKINIDIVPGTRAGYPLPYGSQLPQLVHGNKVLIGDSASMINPLTGEGIYYALYAGKALAGQMTKGFSTDNELKKALADFEVEFVKRFYKHYQLNLTLKRVLSSPFSGLLLNVVAKDKVLLNKVMNIVLGNSGNFDVGNLRYKMFRRSAKYIYNRFRESLGKAAL